MININWFYLLLQRPLVTILLFALVSCTILIVLQTIADRPDQDNEVQLGEPSIRFIHNAELVPSRVAAAAAGEFASAAANRYDIVGQDDLRDLEMRIADLRRIKSSVREELRSMQREKAQILRDKASLTSRNERILMEISRSKHQLKQLELDIQADRKQRSKQSCTSDILAPIIFSPLHSASIEDYAIKRSSQKRVWHHEELRETSIIPYEMDLSLCPLTKQFSFSTTFHSGWLSSLDEANSDSLYLTNLLGTALLSHRHRTAHPDACLTVILMANESSAPSLEDSRNNLLIDLTEVSSMGRESRDPRRNESLASRACIVSFEFKRGEFRPGIDVVIPSIVQPPDSFGSIIGSIPLQSPLQRKYLASYFGEPSARTAPDKDVGRARVHRTLQTIHRSSIDDMFLFIYDCGVATNRACFNERDKMIELSKFLIIIPDDLHDIDRNTNDLIYLALAKGTIPVIMGSEWVRLPLDEAIDWRRCTILLPSGRLPELHFILRSLAPADVYALKYAGRRVFESYLATTRQLVDATLSLISLNRLKFPPAPVEPTETATHFPSGDLIVDTNCSLPACREAKSDLLADGSGGNSGSGLVGANSLLAPETLGPREIPFASPRYTRNYSLTLNGAYDLWNSPMHWPGLMYPSHPQDPPAPSEYKFLTSDPSYRPINDGLGGSGAEFAESLGGDHPNEQFTIVLLTYERIELMMRTLERLKGLAYLNKVLVVWNGIHRAPPRDLIWPDIGVPIVVVKVDRNSLNNRFLPYDAIQTDAIFSMDDDSPLRPDEIVFAFRVWRESRDRIVGFPGRFHAWDGYQNSWMYNSNHSCELSMVLTGGAFFHKYYAHVYTNLMPDAIRTIVDKFMNCEDIAMNFLVAHLTRKPPIKVTSRWTFHCAACTSSLSEDDTHFMERHECLNIFTSIYGYMPLLNTQHRSDSILFKTRLPRDKQKCFRFV